MPNARLNWRARRFDIEAHALLGLKARQGEGFTRAVQAMLACRGRVVVMGMGKSGHVGRKIAATLASTGTPAMFVHPAEASHGDLGMVTAATSCSRSRTPARATSWRRSCRRCAGSA